MMRELGMTMGGCVGDVDVDVSLGGRGECCIALKLVATHCATANITVSVSEQWLCSLIVLPFLSHAQ